MIEASRSLLRPVVRHEFSKACFEVVSRIRWPQGPAHGHSPVRLIGKEGQKPEALKMVIYPTDNFFNDCCEAAARLGGAFPRTRASVRSALVRLSATQPKSQQAALANHRLSFV